MNGSISGTEPARSNDGWGDIPHARRVAWCRTLLDFPPVWLGTMPMIATSRAVQRGEYNTIRAWVDVAGSFESAGFTPETYYTLRLTLVRHLLEGKRNRSAKLVVSGGGNHPEIVTLRASDWALWPALVESGMTPLRATNLILADGDEGLPQGFLMDGDGNIVLSTDD